MEFLVFLKKYRDLSGTEFVSRFNHGFLLINKREDNEGGDGREFRTKLSHDLSDYVKAGHDDARLFPLLKRGSAHSFSMITVGRSSANDLVLEKDAISKFHAYFKRNKKGEYTVSDAGSTNGTTVNSERLEKNIPVTLVGGEAISFGNTFVAAFHTPTTLYGYISVVKRII